MTKEWPRSGWGIAEERPRKAEEGPTKIQFFCDIIAL